MHLGNDKGRFKEQWEWRNYTKPLKTWSITEQIWYITFSGIIAITNVGDNFLIDKSSLFVKWSNVHLVLFQSSRESYFFCQRRESMMLKCTSIWVEVILKCSSSHVLTYLPSLLLLLHPVLQLCGWPYFPAPLVRPDMLPVWIPALKWKYICFNPYINGCILGTEIRAVLMCLPRSAVLSCCIVASAFSSLVFISWPPISAAVSLALRSAGSGIVWNALWNQ